MAVSPKDGFLYGFDRADNKLPDRVPVTKIENAGAPFWPDTETHFCPGDVGGVTPTSEGIVFLGDLCGNFYAVDAATSQKLWDQGLGGAIGGGVITYTADGVQKVAVATGFMSPAWPVQIRTSKVVIFGLEGASAQ
jgi:PQQ-like domain